MKSFALLVPEQSYRPTESITRFLSFTWLNVFFWHWPGSGPSWCSTLYFIRGNQHLFLMLDLERNSLPLHGG